jgi:hypothetical protein
MTHPLATRLFGFLLLAGLLLVVPLAEAAGKASLQGHWKYASGESEGSTTSVYGDLKFRADGSFDDSRRIGGIGGFRKGSYSVSGDRLTLKYDGGKSSQTYTFAFGTSTDRDGKAFQTLLLRGTGLSFVLTRKE